MASKKALIERALGTESSNQRNGKSSKSVLKLPLADSTQRHAQRSDGLTGWRVNYF